MAHCNGTKCSKTTRYDPDRVCDCDCAICVVQDDAPKRTRAYASEDDDPRTVEPEARSVALVGAVAVSALSAAFWVVVVALQMLAFMATQRSEMAVTALWNFAICIVLAWISVGLWKRSRRANQWAQWTHVVNAGFAAYFAFNGSPIMIAAIPLHVIGAALAWVSRGEAVL